RVRNAMSISKVSRRVWIAPQLRTQPAGGAAFPRRRKLIGLRADSNDPLGCRQRSKRRSRRQEEAYGGRLVGSLTVLGWLVLLPTTALAQATIAGTARDASGSVLPRVTVEAASPVLIEKIRTTVTDGNGQFQIIDLQPGTYTVTFT